MDFCGGRPPQNPHRLITCPRTPKKKAGRPAKCPNYAARYSSYRKSQGPDFKTKEAARKRTARREASRSRSLSAQYACDELKILKQSCARQTQKIAKLKEKLAELEERLEAAENTPKPAGRCPEEMEVRLPRVAFFFSLADAPWSRSAPLPPPVRQRALKSDELCLAYTGLTLAEYTALWAEIAPQLASLTQQGKKRERAAQSPSPGRKAISDTVIFWLSLRFMYRYDPQEILANVADFDARNLLRHIWRCIDAIDQSFELRDIRAYTKADWDALVAQQAANIRDKAQFLRNEKIALVIDGTEVRVGRPAERFQKLRYSAKKKQHSLNILVICTLNGRVLWVSPEAQDGSACDQAFWNNSGLREDVFEKFDVGILGDGGFVPNTKKHVAEGKKIRTCVPVRRPAKVKVGKKKKEARPSLGLTEKLYNLWVSQISVVVLVGSLPLVSHVPLSSQASSRGRECDPISQALGHPLRYLSPLRVHRA
jgi:hypothetical protein